MTVRSEPLKAASELQVSHIKMKNKAQIKLHFSNIKVLRGWEAHCFLSTQTSVSPSLLLLLRVKRFNFLGPWAPKHSFYALALRPRRVYVERMRLKLFGAIALRQI